MKGIVATHFKEFVESNLNGNNWKQVLHDVGLASDLFGASDDIPDQVIVQVVQTTAKVVNKPVSDVLYEFGVFEMLQLFDVYSHMVTQRDAKQFLLTAHDKIRQAVNKDFQGKGQEVSCPFLVKKTPPLLEVKESGADTLKMYYRSPRKLCPFNEGIIQAVAQHYNVKIASKKHSCMNKGANQCEYELNISNN